MGKRKTSEFKKFEEKLEKDVSGAEKWMIERRRFFVRLGIFIVFLIFILLYKWFFMK